jgi:hypothetical protein
MTLFLHSFSLSLLCCDFEAFTCDAKLKVWRIVKLNVLVKTLFLEKSIVMLWILCVSVQLCSTIYRCGYCAWSLSVRTFIFSLSSKTLSTAVSEIGFFWVIFEHSSFRVHHTQVLTSIVQWHTYYYYLDIVLTYYYCWRLFYHAVKVW